MSTKSPTSKPKIIATNHLESTPFDLQISFDKFSQRDLYANDSCVFSAPGKSHLQFFLRLHANHLGSIVLELHFVRSGTTKKKVIVHSKVSLLDQNGEKWNDFGLGFNKDFYVSQTSGAIQIFSYVRNSILDSSSVLLVNDKLTFLCEFNFFTDLDNFVISEHGAAPVALSEMQQITRDLDNLFSTRKLSSDVVLLVGGKEFPAHKAILAARSPVFGAMFRHSDTKEAREQKVEIPDVDCEVFEHFLRFIYTGKLPLEMKAFAGDLFVAADKYQLESLKAICEQRLCGQLSAESVHKLAVLADLHSAPVLKAAALEYFRKNTLETINSLFESNKTEALFKAFGALALEDRKNEAKD